MALAVGMAAAPLAGAHSSFELRYFGLNTFNSAGSVSAEDRFNDGTPATGFVFQTSGGLVPGSYLASTSVNFSAGAERSGAASDFVGQQFGVGGLSYRYGDSINATSNLTPAGFASRSLSLSTAAVPSTALGLVDSQKGFEAYSLWNFASLASGESIFLGLGGSSAGIGSDGATNYRDRLQLRYVSNTSGVSSLNFELQTRQDGVFTRTPLASRALNSVPVDLSQVDYLMFQLEREAPSVGNTNPAVHATVRFMDAAYDAVNDQPVVLYGFTFAATGTTFLDSRFVGVFNAATWLDAAPVPEPSRALLLGLGLMVVAGGWRRRQGGQRG